MVGVIGGGSGDEGRLVVTTTFPSSPWGSKEGVSGGEVDMVAVRGGSGCEGMEKSWQGQGRRLVMRGSG